VLNRGPLNEKKRYVILDALRGLALAGIALANFPEFSLWTFLSTEEQAAMSTSGIDSVVKYLQYLLIDGKFYTIFSLLFGVGFSLILSRNSVTLFLRRMLVLACIGICHLMFIWSGDILLLYAIGGIMLSFFVFMYSYMNEKRVNKILFVIACVLILIPVGLDALTEYVGIDFARPFYDAWWSHAADQGITEKNFASWLRDAETYPEMFSFLIQGAYERIWEFVGGHRLPKVLGLFIIGSLIGRKRLYAHLAELPLYRFFFVTLTIGLPISMSYAWSAMRGHPWGLTVHSFFYAFSVVPLAFSYISGLCLIYLRVSKSPHVNTLFRLLAFPGRMALTCYISQSFIGILLFYGVGFGLGTTMGLVYVEIIAIVAFIIQIVFCYFWFHFFRFGPLEWIWRILTYGHIFPIRIENRG